MVFAKDITDFSVDAGSVIDISDLADFQALTSANYSGTFNSVNVFSLNTDLNFSGQAKSAINNFQGTFNGNFNRLSNHDDTYVFNSLNTGAVVSGVVFHNFNASSLSGITASISGTASVANCVCCGTFVTGGGAFCSTVASTSSFHDNIVMVSGSSRFDGGSASGIVGRYAEPMTRCFFAGTSDVFIRSGGNAGTLFGDGNVSGENACNFNGHIIGRYESGGLVGDVDNTPNGCIGMYACGSFSVFAWNSNDYSGRIIGRKSLGYIVETYYHGSGDVLNATGRSRQAGFGINSATVFSERRPSFEGSNYLDTDYVVGAGLKGTDTSVWAGGSFSGPDILRNVPHLVPVEGFEKIYDPIGTIQVQLTNVTDYPVFMRFNFDDPNVSVTLLDSEYREVTGYKGCIVSKYHAFTSATEVITNPSGLEFYVNTTPSEFAALVEPSAVVAPAAKTISDFSVYIGDIGIGDFDDLSAMFLENYSGSFHPGNRFVQAADVQYPDSTTLSNSSYIANFKGVFDGNGFRLVDVSKRIMSLTKWSTVSNVSVHHASVTLFSGHTDGCIVRRIKVSGDIIVNSAVLTHTTSTYGIFEDCQILASGNSVQNTSGVAFTTGNFVRRIFVSTQPGHLMSSGGDIGGVMGRANTYVSKIGCNMTSLMASNRDRIGLLFAEVGLGQSVCKGFYGCGNTTILGLDRSMGSGGIAGDGGTLYEFFSANSGDFSMQSAGRTALVPGGRGTLFADFTGKVFDQSANADPVVESNVEANQGGMYSQDVSIWTAPWDVSSHLDYPALLCELPHFIPLPDDQVVNDIACTIQLYASGPDGYGAFFKIQGDRYQTDYHVDLIGGDSLPSPVDGSWVVQFVFPYEVESTKSILFRGTTLSSSDSKTYVIGGIPFAPFSGSATFVEAKNVTDFSVHSPDVITMNDLADFQAVIGVTSFHPLNVYNMTADVDFQSITSTHIFNQFDGTFDGKGFRIMNRNSYTFNQIYSSTAFCTIKNVVFYNTFGGSPVLNLYGRGKIVDCVSCGIFGNAKCGLVQNLSNYSSIENCYVLASGSSVMNAGISSSSSGSSIGVSKSFFCGSSSVSIDNGNNDTGCIGTSLSLGGGLGVNFLGSVTSTGDVGGIVGESKLINGLGYYVCGDFTLTNGIGTVERLTQSSTYLDEVYYANRGAITGGTSDVTQGLVWYNGLSIATAFAEFTGTYNNVGITQDVNNSRNGGGGVYSRSPNIWWSPWAFTTTRPSFLRDTPHFVPIESSQMHSDVLGDITVEMEDISKYPVFVRLDYIDDTSMRIRFFTKRYIEITSAFAALIVLPLAAEKTFYHGDTVVTSTDSITYAFGVALGTLVPGFGTVVDASTMTDFSGFVDMPILVSTAVDIQAMYKTNYPGSFGAYNEYYLQNDIDLHQETFDTSNDKIISFKGKLNGGGFKLSNHPGNFLSVSTGAILEDITFLGFRGAAIDGTYAGKNLVFVSGNLEGDQYKPMMGTQTSQSAAVTKIKVFLYGNTTLRSPAIMSSVNGASELFLTTTSGVHHNLGNSGIMFGGGAPGFNVGCNVNGTFDSSYQCGVIMSQRNVDIDGGGYYVSGNLDIVRNNGSLSHTMNVSNNQHRADQGGVYTAIRGVITDASAPGTLVTDSYLGSGAGYQTAFKGFVQGISADQHGISGASETNLGTCYDVSLDLWTAPWILADQLDHPSMLRGLPHYMAFENRDTIPSILGDIRLFTLNYPVFLEVEYVDNGDTTDSFVYTVFDTTHSPVTEAVTVQITYPFQVRSETSIVFGGEEVSSDDSLNYLLGDPVWFEKSSPLSFVVIWIPVQDAESYEVTIEQGTAGEVVVDTELATNRAFVQNLDPETQYTIRVYFRVAGGSYSLVYTTLAVTANPYVPENYTAMRDEVQDATSGVFDLSKIRSDRFEYMEDIVQDIFPDKAVLKMNAEVDGVEKELTALLVHRGSSVDVTSTDAILTSFNSTETDQFIELTTDDQGNVERLNYNPATNTFTYGGQTYNVGDSIEVNGKSVRILDD